MKQKILFTLSLAIATIAIFWACQKDEELPEVIGNNKIELTITEDSTSYVFAQLSCALSEMPKFTVGQYGFCWDTIAHVTTEKQSNSFGSLTSQTFQKNIENLLPNKIYYAKAYIQNSDVIIYSNELIIQTKDARPVVTTSEITNITGISAESGGEAKAYEVLFPITQRGVCWAKTQNPIIADNLTINGTGNGEFTSQAQNLDVGINYYVRAYAINSEGISYGDEKGFSTLDGVPELTTDSINDVTAISAIFYGNIIENDGLEILEKGFCWNTSSNPSIENNSQIISENTLGSFHVEITELAVSTTFYVKAYIKNSEGTFYGEELNFTTEDGLASGLTTTGVTDIAATTATSGGDITDDGGFAITAHGVCWSTSTEPTISDAHTTDGSGIGSFTSSLTGLDVNTTYYVRSYATNSTGTVYGNEQCFTTEDGLPSGITTTAITDIIATTATSGGSITDDGGFAITTRGVCWGTNSYPTIADAHTTDGTGTGSFVSSLTGLDVNTTYYVRTYATNSIGTVYGNELSFTTEDGLPSGLTTTEVTNITATTATSGGEITNDGGFAITVRGVCWSTSTEPTITDSHTTDGSGDGNFISNLTGLQSGTVYYVRAYATNSIGTVYGNEQSFTSDRPDITGQTGTLTDYDGNTYNWVGIGKQAWMGENLKVTHYPDGSAIPLVTDKTAWANLGDNNTDDAYCYYNNYSSSQYGVLYTWIAAMGDNSVSSNTNPSGVQGVCPDGWHLPSDAEWQELVDFIASDGHSGTEGIALKSTSGWNSDGNGTNNYGFNALPGGIRGGSDGSFDHVGNIGYWWCSTEYITYAYKRSLDYYNADVSKNAYFKSCGLSVRCVKD